MNNPSKNLKLAEQGALLAIVTYILLSTTKLIAGSMLHSSSLTADGFNNISDIVANIAVLIGLRMARKPADMDHNFGHWKIEDLASLITSLIMFFVGLDVLFETVQKIISKQVTAIDPLGAIVGFISAIIMTGVYLFNKKLAKRANSKALEAAAKDNLSDAITSLGTSIAIIASALNYPLVDQGSQLDNLLSEEFFYISQDGRQLNKAEFQAEKSSEKKFKNFELISISHKTKLIRYQIDDVLHTSIWRRHENWQNIFHQETRKGD